MKKPGIKKAGAKPAKKPAPKTSAPKPKAKTTSRGMSEAEYKKIALTLPGTLEGTSYGKPSILVVKKFLTRLRAEDNSLVLIVGSIDERDMLLEADPATFHITDHYKDYPAVLARLDRIDAATLRSMLERRWRTIAPKKLIKELEAK
ncbi:MAG TPA: hypothetical protein VKB71_15070 [Rhizomicrobium sp.]|nr:hypothetical protein [Rhizomicrobium sp.]